ncbi:hypothetical protein AMK26_11055 [Streptomyces sp. CB03234]|nr:hypothetical protein AMK26_11055 [Streptomyces sp. CB03234]
MRPSGAEQCEGRVGDWVPARLPDPLSDGMVERARALVRAAAALRGWLLPSSAEADEVNDPYGAPITFFRSIGEELQQAWIRWSRP